MLAKLITALRKRLKSRKVRLALAATVGSLLGLSCTFLSEQYQAPCHLAAKLLGFFLGGV